MSASDGSSYQKTGKRDTDPITSNERQYEVATKMSRTGFIQSQVYQAGPGTLLDTSWSDSLWVGGNSTSSLTESMNIDATEGHPHVSQFAPIQLGKQESGSYSLRMPESTARQYSALPPPVVQSLVYQEPCPVKQRVYQEPYPVKQLAYQEPCPVKQLGSVQSHLYESLGVIPAHQNQKQSEKPTFKFKPTKTSSFLLTQLQSQDSQGGSKVTVPRNLGAQDQTFEKHNFKYPRTTFCAAGNLPMSKVQGIPENSLGLTLDDHLNSTYKSAVEVACFRQPSAYNTKVNDPKPSCTNPEVLRINIDPRQVQGDHISPSVAHQDIPSTDTNPYPVSSLPPHYQHIFTKFSHFNNVQSEVLPDILDTDNPIVVASPTGSGKTVLFELAIIRLHQQVQSSKGETDFKIVYIAPIKALCNERYQDWTRKFNPLGVKVVEITGDQEGQDVEKIKSHNMIITTPEKWDAVSRWMSITEPEVMGSVRLLLIDEVHLLNDKTRGHVLEAVVCRFKAIACPARYVAVSATFPNVEDIAFWLGGFQCIFFKFGEEVRPVKLRRVVIGYSMYEGQNEFKFEMNLSYKLDRIINSYSEGMPTLIFCNSRKSTMNTSTVLARDFKGMVRGVKRTQLMNLAIRLMDEKLKSLVMEHGIGYHHAGLLMEDRKLIEELFTEGLLPVLTCTSTLAMGVNLPAHLVVIKSTQQMVAGAWREYSESQILQMAGRAGRPQFCDTATVVIMTRQEMKIYYDRLIEGSTMVESNLHSHLVEHLNAEIIIGTIKDVNQATDWIKSTFLYQRVRRNPLYYEKSSDMSMDQLENSMHDMCLEALQSMSEVGVITMNEQGVVGGTSLGKLMSRFYLAFSTMVQLTSVNSMESMLDMLGVICESRELSEAVLRITERKTLNSLNRNKEKNTIRFPLEGKIKTKEMKVNVLIQASLGSMHIPDPGLNMETPRYVKMANRITTCLVELIMNDPEKSKNYNLVKNALCLMKSLECGIWDNSKFVVKQMRKVGPVISSALVKGGFTSFPKLGQANPRMIELTAKKSPPFGNNVRDFALGMPQYRLELKQGETKQNSAQVDILVTMINKEVVKQRNEVDHDQHRWVVLVGNGNNKAVATFKGCDTLLISGHSVFQRSFRLPKEHWEDRLEVFLISLSISGVDVSSVLNLHLPGMIQPPVNLQRPPSLAQFRRECKHTCVDKQKCAHICCKDGVMQKTKADSFMDNITRIRATFKDKFNNTIIGGEENHGLAREWDESFGKEEE